MNLVINKFNFIVFESEVNEKPAYMYYYVIVHDNVALSLVYMTSKENIDRGKYEESEGYKIVQTLRFTD